MARTGPLREGNYRVCVLAELRGCRWMGCSAVWVCPLWMCDAIPSGSADCKKQIGFSCGLPSAYSSLRLLEEKTLEVYHGCCPDGQDMQFFPAAVRRCQIHRANVTALSVPLPQFGVDQWNSKVESGPTSDRSKRESPGGVGWM